MHIFEEITDLKNYIQEQRIAGRKLSLVPTMGALHRGHTQLVKSSLENADVTVCSIYVNPTQFNNPQDLINYPRDLESDFTILRQQGCQAVFVPNDETMYEHKPLVELSFGHLGQGMEGAHRPGHFAGVGLVVAKLFNLVEPDIAYFGEKDWQQLTIIKRLVSDLNFPVEIRAISIIREPDGLALSSRNQRLTTDHRTVAPQLFQALMNVKEALEAKQSCSEAREQGLMHLRKFPEIKLDYLEIVTADSLQPPSMPLGQEVLRVCLAATLGKVRLIDNSQVF